MKKKRPFIKKTLLMLIGIAMFLMLCASLFLLYWVFVDYRYFPLKEGKVYRSAAMPEKTLVSKIRKYKIRTVIDLRDPEDGPTTEKETLEQLGVQHINLPSKQVPSYENIQKFLSIIDNPENKPLLFHCKHGVGRAGAFSAIYRMEYDKWDNEFAIRESRWLSLFGSFKRGSSKEVFLRNYIPRWKHSKSK